MKRLITVLLCISSTSWATVTIFDSNSIISDGEVYDQVVVKGNGTIVQMTGGTVNALVTMDAAVFNMTEGTVGVIFSHDDSQLNLSGGSVLNPQGSYAINSYGHSIVSLSGDVICSSGVFFQGNSTIYVSDSAHMDLDEVRLREFFESIGEKPFRAEQLLMI